MQRNFNVVVVGSDRHQAVVAGFATATNAVEARNAWMPHTVNHQQ